MAKQNVMVPAALLRRAEKLDSELRHLAPQWLQADKQRALLGVKIGKILTAIEAEGLHKLIRKGNSRKGYVSLEEYAKSIFGVKHSSYFTQKKQGELANSGIPDETVADIGPRNSIILSKVPPERRTPELIEKATKQTEREFAGTAQAAINEGQPKEKQTVMRVEFFRRWHPEVLRKFEDTVEKYTRLKAVRLIDPDDAGGLTLQEKALLTMCSIADGWADGEECARKEEAIDLGGPEAAEAVAQAEEADSEEPYPSEEVLAEAERLEDLTRDTEDNEEHHGVIVMPSRSA
jgi:hypothetical protein